LPWDISKSHYFYWYSFPGEFPYITHQCCFGLKQRRKKNQNKTKKATWFICMIYEATPSYQRFWSDCISIVKLRSTSWKDISYFQFFS
jgi:hypothetical protein